MYNRLMKSDKDLQKKTLPKVAADISSKGLYQKAQSAGVEHDSKKIPLNSSNPLAAGEKILESPAAITQKERSEESIRQNTQVKDDLPLPDARVISDEKKSAANFDFDDEVFDTVLEENINFTGTIKFSKPFMIKGIVRGNIIATSDLVIDTTARVAANIKADKVLIRGAVRGNVCASSLVRVFTTGELTGDITAANVVLDPGSNFCGKCTMTK